MNEATDSGEICRVCGKSTAGDRGFAHRYHDGRRFALCCPMCLRIFEQARDRLARGDRPPGLLQQLIEEIKWRDAGD